MVDLTGIGRADAEPIGGPSPLAISPDQRSAAFVLQRADIEENRYCQALIVIDLDSRSAARVVDRGGDYMTATVAMRGMSIANGFPQQMVPRWSPDGRKLAYLRRNQRITQLWSVSVHGGTPRQLTREPVDVISWAWMSNGCIGYAVEADRLRIRAASEAEGRTGWVYDQRVAPNLGFRPQPPASVAAAYKIIDPRTGAVVAATGPALDQLRAALAAQDAARRAIAGAAQAWTEAVARSPLAPRRLHAIDATGVARPCGWASCTGRFEGLWWLGEKALTFLKRDGWDGRYTALYRWVPGRKAPRLLLRTDDLLERCTLAAGRLLCIHEAATRPSHIVAIDLASGAVRDIFDPNRGIGARIKSKVRRITWQTAAGRPVYGDLVLPPAYEPGTRLPTIITLYHSRGFLRGGTGNEYPIFLFAQRGYAVLSIERPSLVAEQVPGLKTYDEIYATNVRDWADLKNVQSAIDAGVARLISQGIADPRRLGITGLSAGAASVRFALINSRRFAAASLSSCCVDETSAVLAGPAWEEYSRSVGYPPAFPVDRRFWRPGSLVLNASRISTPLLMQLADSEALYGIPSFVALRQYHQPVELRVFPGEFHIKWQPTHRAAIYETNLDWFDFWLRNTIDPDPAKAAQYGRWKQLRSDRTNELVNASARP